VLRLFIYLIHKLFFLCHLFSVNYLATTQIPDGWLHSEGGAVGNTEKAWEDLSREKQTEAQV
jgi:hypothetical protein